MPATTVLPDRDELSLRLAEADPDRTAEGLYPGILKMAERTLSGSGVAVMLSLAIAEHMEERDYGDATNVYTLRLLKLLPDFINAIVDDEQVRADALATLERSRRP